ncbi:MAG: hypothetical protein RL758_562 [Pseudomonadota bacterium]|jgi:hypothetical protein
MVFGWFKKSTPEKTPRQRQEFQDTPVHTPTAEELRHERRGQVLDVVRECMLIAGILSAGYKFKVLEADASHKQFLVLFDLGTMFHCSTERLSDLEGMIQESARHRYDLEIKHCYWRVVPDPHPAHATPPQDPVAEPAPDPRALARAQLDEIFAKDPAGDSREPASEFAPTQFSNSIAKLHSNEHKKGSHLLLTGFEETELANSAFKPSSLKHKS